MADGKSEKAPSAVTENKEEPPTEQAPPSEGANRSMAARSTPPMNQGSRGKGGAAPCFGDCIVTPMKFPTLGLDDIKSPSFIKMLGGEFLGTLLLVFFGIGSVVTAHTGPPLVVVKGDSNVDKDYYSYEAGGPNPNKLHVSFAFGIAVACIAQAIGHISGCHLNPAVSFGLWAAGQCGLLKALCYVVAQCFGALVGAGLLRFLTMHLVQLKPNHDTLSVNATFDEMYMYWGLGASTLAPGVDIPTGILIECLLTFILVLTVCGCCDAMRNDIKGSAPLAIGFAVFVCHVTGIGFTGASVNPARSFGPAIVAYNVKNVWMHHAVYWIGPILGGLEAGVTYGTFFRAKGDPKPASDERSVVP